MPKRPDGPEPTTTRGELDPQVVLDHLTRPPRFLAWLRRRIERSKS